jgi:opacity protein-like surface antigen
MRNQALRALTVGAATLAAAALAGTGARAADMAAPMAPAQQFNPQPVELGTGWYLRGDIGYALEKPAQLDADLAVGSKRRGQYDVTLGAGYKFNNWMRADMTYDWRPNRNASNSGSAPCVTAAASGVFTTAQCDATSTTTLKQHAVLANGYVDLGSWAGVSPYLGAGVGFAKLGVSGANAYQLAGVAPPAAIVDSVTGATYAFNYGKVLSKNYYNMAWALMAGFGYDINANAKLDIGYRYLNAGTYGALSPVTGKVTKKTMDSHEVRVGVRYMIDGNGI